MRSLRFSFLSRFTLAVFALANLLMMPVSSAQAAACVDDAQYSRSCADAGCSSPGTGYVPNTSLTCTDTAKKCCEKKKEEVPADEASCKKIQGNCSAGTDCKSDEMKKGICGKRATGIGQVDIPCCVASTDTAENCVKNGGRCSDSSDCMGNNERKEGSCGKRATGVAGTDYACCVQIPAGTQTTSTGGGSFTPLERIPFLDEDNPDFPTYVKAIYNFAIWSVAIAALLMIVIGGFFYLTAAGNTSQLGTAKTIIWDALIGLFVAFFAWLVLYEINPDLVSIDLSSLSSLYSSGSGGSATQFGASGSGGSGGTTPPAQQGPGNGKCQPVPSGPCSVESLKGTCMANGDAAKANRISQLCNKESQGSPTSRSGVDICLNYGRRSFSGGLFQINVFANGKMIDSSCANLGSKGTCANRRASDKVCLGWNCQINNLATFDKCMSLTFTAASNIQAACKLSNNGSNLTPWACSANKCGLGGTSSKFCK